MQNECWEVISWRPVGSEWVQKPWASRSPCISHGAAVVRKLNTLGWDQARGWAPACGLNGLPHLGLKRLSGFVTRALFRGRELILAGCPFNLCLCPKIWTLCACRLLLSLSFKQLGRQPVFW